MKIKKIILILGAMAIGSSAMNSPATAEVPLEDVMLVPIVSDNLPVFYSLTGYVNRESRLDPEKHQMPLYTPYESKDPDWWDQMVAEQLQGRMSVMLLSTRGVFVPDDPNDWEGRLNPRQLVMLLDAFDRAGVTPELMKLSCFVDTPVLRRHYVDVAGVHEDSNVDFSDTDNVAFTYFERGVKPWFDTIPSEWWFTVDMGGEERPLIEFWRLHPNWADNMDGNVSTMLTNVADRFENTYGVRPAFNISERLVTDNQDSTVTNQADVYVMNDWFRSSDDESYTLATHNGVTAGAMVPGFARSTWKDPEDPDYLNPDHFIARNGSDGLGENGDTLLEGLEAMMSNGAAVVTIEGWTDDAEWAGLYRSLDVEWDNPNQYINLMRRYNDLRTETLRLEFEGADAYHSTTSGNAGNSFRRSGDLDVYKLPGDSGGWSVELSAEGEWVEFRDVYLAPDTYTFSIRYAATSTEDVSLSVNGDSLGNVELPSTGGDTVYKTFSLGNTLVLEGEHTLRLTLASSGALNLDWLFVKRETLTVALNSSLNNQYVTAVNGGGDLVQADSATAANHQEFIICDRNGGTLESGDQVNIQARNGLYLAARSGGNNDLEADRMDPGGWERFTISKANGSGGTITSGTEIALQSIDGYYVRTTSSGLLDVRGTTIEDATTFTMTSHTVASELSPAVSFDSPPSTHVGGEDLHLKVNAGSLNGIDRVYLYKNGVELNRSEGSTPYQWGAPGQNDPELQNMQPGVYEFSAVARDTLGNESEATTRITVVSPGAEPPIYINFQPASAAVPSGYLADTSEVFGDRGNGYSYGWTTEFDRTRERNNHTDQRLDTLNHTQWNGDRVWEIELPNGDYDVSITGGDPNFEDSFIEFIAEAGTANETTLISVDDKAGFNFVSGSAMVTVSDGRLTISNGPNAVDNKINYVDITPLTGPDLPEVSFDSPPSAILEGEDLHLKLNASAGSGIDRVYLYKNGVELNRSESAEPYQFGAPGQNDPELQDMQAGIYEFKAVARDNLDNESEATIFVEVVVPGGAPTVNINFQPSLASVPSGYLADTSEVFGDRGNGYSYGWDTAFDETRERNADSDQRLDTLNHTQQNGENHFWEIELANGDYLVRLTGGDPSWDNSFIEFIAEEGTANEVTLASGDADGVNFISGSVVVTVSDGRLTINNGPNAVNNKINYMDITPLEQQPSVSINFQPASASVPSDYLADTSEPFGDRGNGFSYGWTTTFDATRERNSDPDQRLDTLNHSQAQGVDRVWEIELPDGTYSVSITGGDPDWDNSFIEFIAQAGTADEVTLVSGDADGVNFVSGTETVTVSNGLLSISNGPNAVNNKINYVDIVPVIDVKINFQPSTASVPSGYLADTSEFFGDRGNGFSYGWTESFDATRERNTDPDQRLDTLNHTQRQGGDRVWEIELPNGSYSVGITGGDPDHDDSFIDFVAQAGTADEVTLVSGDADGVNFVSGTETVTVSNGLLTISNGPNAVNNKINYVDIVTSSGGLGGLGGTVYIDDSGPDSDAYANWKAEHHITDDSGDEDNDGISNLLEYALGGDPRTPGTAKLPQVNVNGDNLEFTLQRQEAGITYVIQKSTDLINWEDYETVTDAHGVVGGEATVTVPASEMENGKFFLRLRVKR